jgi:4-amino-4-deoxy-L-arabinose transferase-like glycosyltransferase
MNDELRQLLRQAKERVVSNWGQGNGSRPPQTAWCLITSLRGAGVWREDAELLLVAAAGIPANSFSCPGFALYNWNDAPGRTQAEVVALFDKVLAGEFPTPKLRERTEMIEGVPA